jgi:universal stress protein E
MKEAGMQRILVVADPPQSGRSPCTATARGLTLAGALDCAVDIVAFTHAPLQRFGLTRAQQAAARRELLDRRELSLRAQIDAQCPAGVRCSLRVIWMQDIANWLLRRLATRRYQLLVKTTHSSGKRLHTSTDWQLLREDETPTLLVTAPRWRARQPVLVALDLATRSRVKQALNRAALAQAGELARGLGVRVHCVTALEVPPLLGDLELLDVGAFARQARADMRPQVEALAAEFGLPRSAFAIRRGPTAEVIAREVQRRDARLVVMGTVGRRGIKARLLGNTAESLLQTLPVDVLAVKPGEGT